MPKINDGKLVARVRATKKSKTLQLSTKSELGGKGVDGRKFYQIRKLAVGSWTCSCPAYRFKRGKVGQKAPCKHMLKLFVDWKREEINSNEIEVLIPEAL